MSAEASRYVATKPPRTTAPKADAFAERSPPPTNFRVMYERGDVPARVCGGVATFVQWHVGPLAAAAGSRPGLGSITYKDGRPTGDDYEQAKARFLEALDYAVWMPLFFEGLREQAEPCRFLAEVGVKDLCECGSYAKVAPVVPLLVLPLRQALNTREPRTVRRAISAMNQLLKVPRDPTSGASVGLALAPYLRHFLPVFNLFRSNPKYARASADYSTCLGDVMDETLHHLAEQGGPGAAKEINRLVPLWEPPPPSATKARGPALL